MRDVETVDVAADVLILAGRQAGLSVRDLINLLERGHEHRPAHRVSCLPGWRTGLWRTEDISVESGMAQWVGNIILLAALVSAVWYAWETRKMRLQMIRPKLVFLTRPHDAETLDDLAVLDLFIRNAGDGAAINVSIDRVEDKSFKMRAEPERIAILEKAEEVRLAIRPVEGSYKPDMNTILDDASISLRFVAKYVDVEGREFCTSTVVGGGAKPPFIKDEKP